MFEKINILSQVYVDGGDNLRVDMNVNDSLQYKNNSNLFTQTDVIRVAIIFILIKIACVACSNAGNTKTGHVTLSHTREQFEPDTLKI